MKLEHLNKLVKNVVDFQTCPLFVGSMKDKHDESWKKIQNLRSIDKKYCELKIDAEIDQYHTPIEGMHGYSASDMNDLVLMN